MAVVHQSFATGTAGVGSSTIAVNKPTGTAAGDVLVAEFTFGGGAHVSTPPSGWTTILGGGGSDTYGIFLKVAGSSEPASYTWALDTTGGGAGGISRYSGVDNTFPLDVSATSAFNSGTTSPVGPITTLTNNAMVIGGVVELQNYTVTPPAALTERWEVSVGGSNVGSEHASGIQASAGSTGTMTWTLSTSGVSRAWVAALRDASASTLTVTGAGIPSSAALGDATLSLGAIQGVGIPSSPVMGRATLTSGLTLVGKGIASSAVMGVAMFNRDSDPSELIFTWEVNKRARAIRFVFETTEPMAKFRVRSLEVWLRATGKQ